MKKLTIAVIGLCILAVWPPVTQAQQRGAIYAQN